MRLQCDFQQAGKSNFIRWLSPLISVSKGFEDFVILKLKYCSKSPNKYFPCSKIFLHFLFQSLAGPSLPRFSSYHHHHLFYTQARCLLSPFVLFSHIFAPSWQRMDLRLVEFVFTTLSTRCFSKFTRTRALARFVLRRAVLVHRLSALFIAAGNNSICIQPLQLSVVRTEILFM